MDFSKAKFYEVIFRQKGNYYSKDGLYTSAIYSTKSKSPITIIRPHFRSFKEFQSGILQIGALLFVGILIAGTANAAHIANYR